MDATQAKRLIIASMVVTGLTATAGTIHDGKAPHLRIGFGLLFAGTVLALGAEVAPPVAGSFALLLMATSLFVYGGSALDGFNSFLARGAPSAVGVSSSPHPRAA